MMDYPVNKYNVFRWMSVFEILTGRFFAFEFFDNKLEAARGFYIAYEMTSSMGPENPVFYFVNNPF